MGGKGQAQRTVAARDLFDGDGVGEGVATRAAVFFGEGHTHEAEGGHLFDHIVGELVCFVAL